MAGENIELGNFCNHWQLFGKTEQLNFSQAHRLQK